MVVQLGDTRGDPDVVQNCTICRHAATVSAVQGRDRRGNNQTDDDDDDNHDIRETPSQDALQGNSQMDRY